jgi:polyphosphate kinase 2 (PPK2 family)
LEVGEPEQKKRFEARIDDPVRQWKLSPTDLESRRQWYAYSRARDEMLAATDTQESPWHLVRSDDKRRARLNVIAHLLDQIPYERVKRPKVKMPPRLDDEAYDDVASIAHRRWIDERF